MLHGIITPLVVFASGGPPGATTLIKWAKKLDKQVRCRTLASCARQSSTSVYSLSITEVAVHLCRVALRAYLKSQIDTAYSVSSADSLCSLWSLWLFKMRAQVCGCNGEYPCITTERHTFKYDLPQSTQRAQRPEFKAWSCFRRLCIVCFFREFRLFR